jgi:hypothetical protein
VNGRLLAPLNSPLALVALPTCSRSVAFFFPASSPSKRVVARGKGGNKGHHSVDGKRNCPPSPPSEDFGGLEYLEEEFSSEYDRSPALASIVASSDDLDDSMGLSAAKRAYIQSVERTGLGGSDDSEEEASSDVEEDSEEGGDGDSDNDDGGDGSSDGDNGNSDGGNDGDGSNGEGSDSNGGNGDGGNSKGGSDDDDNADGNVPPD